MDGQWWNSPDAGASSESPIATCEDMIDFDPVTGESRIRARLDGPQPQPAQPVQTKHGGRLCRQCVFGEFADNDEPYGLCRRNPPRSVMSYEVPAGERLSTQWPAVRYDDWCGEFA